ncbi:PEGA domain-containing protein [Flavobacteriaceae bacterium]|nr:PEGA domain-containing protein [Flavobacteriaceae bacterium]
MKHKILFLALTITFLMSSCATILTGTRDTIRFDSNPKGAIVYFDGLEVCKTPCSTSVKRSISEKFAEIKLDGYETRVITLDRKFNAVSIINLTSILGWGIDAATGALMKYDRKGYDIKLDKEKRTSLNNPTKIEINTKKKTVDVYVTER